MNDSASIEIRKDTLWRFRRLSQDEFVMRREIRLEQPQQYFDAMGPVTSFGICKRHAGALFYESAGVKIAIPWQEYGVFMPRFTLTRAASEHLDLNVDFMMTTAQQEGLPGEAFIFPLDLDKEPPKNFAAVRDFLPPPHERILVDFCPSPTALSRRIKAALDQSFMETIRFSSIARQLNVSPTILGRYFKRNFGLSPLAYRNHMRIMSASLELVAGAEIINSYQTVGFDDLSQFYKQFKRVTKATPGEYRSKKSKFTKR